jgi:hypothetical protein
MPYFAHYSARLSRSDGNMKATGWRQEWLWQPALAGFVASARRLSVGRLFSVIRCCPEPAHSLRLRASRRALSGFVASSFVRGLPTHRAGLSDHYSVD